MEKIIGGIFTLIILGVLALVLIFMNWDFFMEYPIVPGACALYLAWRVTKLMIDEVEGKL